MFKRNTRALGGAALCGALLVSGCANQMSQRSEHEERVERKLLDHSLQIDVGEPKVLELPQRRVRIHEQKTFEVTEFEVTRRYDRYTPYQPWRKLYEMPLGAVALVVLMTPIVVRNTEEMLRLVSNELREAAYALGVRKSRTIVHVVLRTSLPGIVSGCVIATARIIGESAPLLITAGATDYYNFSMFNDRVMTLPVFVYNQYVAGNFSMAWAGALVLVLIVLLLNLFARIIARVFAPKGQ